ncbi:MAG: hypothetical protein ACRDAI_02115 [Candidatus Rhabdochlamydia sp.]
MNYINCLKHSIFIPQTDHRRYDLDLQGNENSKIRRIALTAIPFIALYRPAGTAISLGMGSCRIVSHLQLIATYQEKQEWKNLSKEVVLTTLAVVSLASNILHIRIGQLLTSSVDTAQSACYTTYYALTGNYHKAAEEALQAIISTFYLTFILTGSLEVILLSVIFQAALQLYQIKDDLFKERYIEATAKLAMTAIRLNQANNYRCLIQKRNAVFALRQNLAYQVSKGRASWHLMRHPLTDLHKKIDENKITLSSLGKEYDFGSHFHGYGKSLVKGANLAFRTVVVDGKEFTECEFKINHVFREKLQNTLNELQKLNPSEISDILQITDSHVQSLSIEEQKDDVNGYDPYKPAYQVIADGLGQITIGASREYPNLFDRIVVLMDKEKNLFDLHELLSLAGLDTAITSSSKDDLDRLKMGHLFRIFFPREATRFERTEAFFTLSTQELLDKMTLEMKEIYDRYFDQIKESEILPGKIRYKVSGLVDEIQGSGGRYLTAAITGSDSKQDLYQRAASMLSLGMLSQEMKAKYQINQRGGYGSDYLTGGADSIYTQMLTIKNLTSKGLDTSDLYYQGKVRLLISLDALENGTYQYIEDNFGTRLVGSSNENCNISYADRLNILEFTKALQEENKYNINEKMLKDRIPPSYFKEILRYFRIPFSEDFLVDRQRAIEALLNYLFMNNLNNYNSNEVMLKDRIPPSYFKGFLVDSQETGKELLDYLRACNLIQKDTLNRETIQGHFVEDFIRISADSSQRRIA